jgi:hypothetical protein
MSDIKGQLRIKHINDISADYGQLPDLTKTKAAHDIVYTWNGARGGQRKGGAARRAAVLPPSSCPRCLQARRLVSWCPTRTGLRPTGAG